MPTQEITITLIIIAVLIFAIFIQVRPQRVYRLRFVILPALAAYEAYTSLPKPTIPVNQIFECLLIIIAALAAGAIQARFTRVYYQGDHLYICGGIVSLLAWIGLLLARFIIGLTFQGFSFFTSFQNYEWMMWIAVAVIFGSKNLILYMKHREIGESLIHDRNNRRQRNER